MSSTPCRSEISTGYGSPVTSGYPEDVFILKVDGRDVLRLARLRDGSLSFRWLKLSVVDRTLTAAEARELREWLERTER